MPDAISAAAAVAPQQDQNLLTAEQVAGVASGIPAFVEACDALRKAGWRASIAGNRITVNDEVFALFISGRGAGGPLGDVGARWMIYDHRHASRVGCWSGASAVMSHLGSRALPDRSRHYFARTDWSPAMQEGYHFTSLSPSETPRAINVWLKFRFLGTSAALVPNLPRPTDWSTECDQF